VTRPATPPFDWLNGAVADLRRHYERCFGAARGAESWRTIAHPEGRLRLLVQQPSPASGRGDSIEPTAHLSPLSHDVGEGQGEDISTRRESAPRCAILYFHGGGWIVGSPRTHADISGALADRTGLTVFSLDYRLAPECPAPAPVIDGCHALSALLRPGDIEGVVLCGDSAGAAIALAVERRAAAAIRTQIRGVCSFYGCFGLRDSPSIREFGDRADGLDVACIERFWTLANGPREPSPYAIDALAAADGVPVYLLAAGRDPLRDDTLALAAAYRSRGRPHHLDLVAGEAHGFLHDAGPSAAATAAIERAAAWILSKCGM